MRGLLVIKKGQVINICDLKMRIHLFCLFIINAIQVTRNTSSSSRFFFFYFFSFCFSLQILNNNNKGLWRNCFFLSFSFFSSFCRKLILCIYNIYYIYIMSEQPPDTRTRIFFLNFVFCFKCVFIRVVLPCDCSLLSSFF